MSTRGHSTTTERNREQRTRCLELTAVQLRIVKIALSIVATLLTVWQAF